jgi:hypothetical protein
MPFGLPVLAAAVILGLIWRARGKRDVVGAGPRDDFMLPGYNWPIAAGPSGVDWKFDPKDVDMSTGEPIVRTREGYWVWGRGCTQPGGGIMPHWGFVRTDGR